MMSKPLDISPENWENLQTRSGHKILFIKQDMSESSGSSCALLYVSEDSDGGLYSGQIDLNGHNFPDEGEDPWDVIEKPKLLLTEQDRN